MDIGSRLKQLKLAHKNMLDRCYNPNNAAYHNYGGRGIEVCPEWKNHLGSFMNWANDFDISSKSIERLDTDGNYCPDNCTWATVTEQLRNQRRNVRITKDGTTKCIGEWAEVLGVRYTTLWKRLQRMPADKALVSGSIMPKWKHGSRAGYETHKCKCSECREANATRHRKARARRKIND